MSIPATIWAWQQPGLPAAQRLALLCLADHANRLGECWPGLEQLAERCGMSIRTARRAIADLERAGLVAKVRRHRHADGSLGVWHYRLPVDNFVAYGSE